MSHLPLIAATLLAVPVLVACSSNLDRPDPHTMAPTTIDKQVVGRTTLAMPLSIPGRSTVLVPFAIESEKDLFQSSDAFAAGGYAGRSASSPASSVAADVSLREYYGSTGGSVRWHNAIFRDLRTQDQWPLLDSRGVLSQWYLFGVQPADPRAPFQTKALVFLATTADTNHDGILNDLDARIAVLTDPDGRHARTISPPQAQVWNVAYDGANSMLYLLIVADSNADGKYDYSDIPTPYSCDLAASAPAAPLVSDAALQRVHSLLK